MTTYAIKVQNTMRSTNPRYSTEGPMTFYYYIGKNGWMSGQSLYEGYSTLRGAKIALAAYMKQHEEPSRSQFVFYVFVCKRVTRQW